MSDITLPPSGIIVPGLDDVYNLLDQNKEDISKLTDPQVSNYLKGLLQGLYDAQEDLSPTPLGRPSLMTIDTMTNSALITLLMNEIRKTNALVIAATGLQITDQHKVIKARNDDQIKKLNEANSAANKANELSKGLGIFKWVMLALSVVLTILSVVATICTFGAAAPLIAISAALLVASIAFTVVSSVPIDDEQNTCMDLMSEAISEGIKEIALENLKAEHEEKTGKSWDSLTDEEQQAVMTEAQETGAYSAMAIVIAIQVIVAVVMLVASLGTSWAASASQVANTATTATRAVAQTAVTSALQAAKIAMQAHMPAIQTAVRAAIATTTIIKALGTLGQAGASSANAYYTYQSETAEAQNQRIKAFVKLLSSNNEMLIALIEQLMSSSSNSWENVSQIIKNNHATQRRIAQGGNGGFA